MLHILNINDDEFSELVNTKRYYVMEVDKDYYAGDFIVFQASDNAVLFYINDIERECEHLREDVMILSLIPCEIKINVSNDVRPIFKELPFEDLIDEDGIWY